MSYFLTIANTGEDEKLDYAYEQVGNALDKAIEIVKQAAAEDNNGWIPCSKEKPKEKGEYSVSYPDGTVSIQYWDGKFFTEVDTVSGKSIIGQPVAWKQKDEPYHQNGE